MKNKSDDVHYGLDFVEFEQAPDPIAQGDNAINIVSKGATPNDDTDDSQALYDAIYEAKQTGKNVYIPAGRFNLNRKVGIDASDMKISGLVSGIPNCILLVTKLVAVDLTSFTKTTMLNLAMSICPPTFVHAMVKMLSTRPFLERQGRILIFTIFGPNILEVGMWISDYAGKNDMKYTDGLVVENVRLRNNLADGVNFAQGTKNSIVRNSEYSWKWR